MVKLNDRSAMTIAVDLRCKATKQKNKMTAFVDLHDWHYVWKCLIEKMDRSPFEL